MCSKGNSVDPSPRRTSLIAYFRSNFAALLSARREKTCPIATIFIFLALWLLVPSFATCQTSEGQVEAFFRTGQEALKQGQFARAAEEFKKVLALDSSLVEAEVNLGLAYQSLFEYDLAVRHLTKGLRERPNMLGPTVIVGMDYLKLGSPEKAIPFLQRALKLDPSNREARQALASCYLGQEDFRSAVEEFRQIAVLDSDKSEAWFKLGHEYLDLSASLAYRGAHLYRESAWGHRFLGDLLFQRSRWDDSVKEYEKALTAEARQPGLHTSLGQAYLHAQKLEDAETEFHLELKLDSGNELAWLGLANLQLARGQATAALESLAKVWEISPEFLVVQREFLSIGPQEAKASLSRLQDETEGAAKHFLLAALYTTTNESALSDRQWKLFQADFSAWQQAPNAAAGTRADQDPCKAHRYSRCAESLQARKQLTDSERLLLGKTYFTSQQYEAAADALAQVQGATNENAEASYWLARTYQALGAEAYARLEESSPNSWRTHQLRAEGYALRQDLDDAFKEFHVALQLRPNESELHEALGELYLDNHSDDDAQSELERALALDPSRTHALYLLGRFYVQTRENEKAVSYLQRALRLQPDLAEASGLLGTAYVRLGQFANAIPKLMKAAPTDHYGNVHYQLYLAYRKLGQTELAQKALARSQDLRRSSLEHDQAVIMGSPQVQAEPQ
ncbi:MAG TPA: tetratricopeptide repeat protein [Candidatus Limnocylindria bacterium]|nr:tetratricopeptide repeat protein [Candidatus Limnocylindria bacterium]